MKLLRRQISASDRIPDRFYVISMEFLSLSRRRFSAAMSEEKRLPFAGYVVVNSRVMLASFTGNPATYCYLLLQSNKAPG